MADDPQISVADVQQLLEDAADLLKLAHDDVPVGAYDWTARVLQSLTPWEIESLAGIFKVTPERITATVDRLHTVTRKIEAIVPSPLGLKIAAELKSLEGRQRLLRLALDWLEM